VKEVLDIYGMEDQVYAKPEDVTFTPPNESFIMKKLEEKSDSGDSK
jgi:hypothetical protein